MKNFTKKLSLSKLMKMISKKSTKEPVIPRYDASQPLRQSIPNSKTDKLLNEDLAIFTHRVNCIFSVIKNKTLRDDNALQILYEMRGLCHNKTDGEIITILDKSCFEKYFTSASDKSSDTESSGSVGTYKNGHLGDHLTYKQKETKQIMAKMEKELKDAKPMPLYETGSPQNSTKGPEIQEVVIPKEFDVEKEIISTPKIVTKEIIEQELPDYSSIDKMLERANKTIQVSKVEPVEIYKAPAEDVKMDQKPENADDQTFTAQMSREQLQILDDMFKDSLDDTQLTTLNNTTTDPTDATPQEPERSSSQSTNVVENTEPVNNNVTSNPYDQIKDTQNISMTSIEASNRPDGRFKVKKPTPNFFMRILLAIRAFLISLFTCDFTNEKVTIELTLNNSCKTNLLESLHNMEKFSTTGLLRVIDKKLSPSLLISFFTKSPSLLDKIPVNDQFLIVRTVCKNELGGLFDTDWLIDFYSIVDDYTAVKFNEEICDHLDPFTMKVLNLCQKIIMNTRSCKRYTKSTRREIYNSIIHNIIFPNIINESAMYATVINTEPGKKQTIIRKEKLESIFERIFDINPSHV